MTRRWKATFPAVCNVMSRSTDILDELEVMDYMSGETIAQWTSEESGWTLKRMIQLLPQHE